MPLFEHGSGRPLPPLGRAAAARVSAASCTRESFASSLYAVLRGVADDSLASSTRRVYSSHVAFFHEFMTILGLDISSFGLPVAQGGFTLDEEETILSLFAVHVWRSPRRRGRGREHNGGRHCQACVAAVRDWTSVEHHREVAPLASSPFLRKTLRGLRRRAPGGHRAPRPPILRQHLAAIRDLLDLAGNQRHRTFFAFILTAWQGVKRSGDLIEPKASQGTPWSPARCLHRGRLRVVRARDASGAVIGKTLVITNKPSKVNPTGEKRDESYYPVDRDPRALSAAVAIEQMLLGDPCPEAPESVPLFRDPSTGCELTYSDVCAFLDYWLTRAGFRELATGTHALRAGGATSVANLCPDGQLLSGLMGHWASSSQYLYVWAMQHRLEEAARVIGRPSLASLPLAARPGPAGRASSGRAPRGGGAGARF
jgi:hypothetical protein